MRSFELELRAEGPATIASVAGTVDAVTAPRLAEALQAEVAAGRHRLVVDLSAVEYVSSAGLRALLAAVKAARAAGGDVVVAAARPAVFEVFELAGLTSILAFHPGVGEAVTGLT